MACMLEMGQSPSVDFPIEMVKTDVDTGSSEDRIPSSIVTPTPTSLHASCVENNRSFVKNQNGYGEAPR